jgi:cellulose synthase/poly-beta-1,6-N-acetylglucosamine synthase-like glycosyltransferase
MTNDPILIVAAIGGIVLAGATLPGTIELLLLTTAGVLPRRRITVAGSRPPHPVQRLAIVVPAHNEEAGIARTVSSLRQACEAAAASDEVVVIADNCDDQTADCAIEAGARVLERIDRIHRGKGFALDYAFGTLGLEGFDAFLVVDADTVVEPRFVVECRRALEAGVDAIQCRYTVNNPNASLRTRLMNVALMAFNVLRPRGRDRLGLSAGLLGNGFGLTRQTLAAVPYDASSVVEDLEYHIRLVGAGRRVAFVDSVTVRADMPEGGGSSKTQRTRWEGGRFRMIVSHAPKLAGELFKGRIRLLEPLLDLLLLPLAFHVILLLLALVPPFTPTRYYAAAAISIVAMHIFASVVVGGGGFKDVFALASVPLYLAWKAALIPRLLKSARSDAAWVRTGRKTGATKS